MSALQTPVLDPSPGDALPDSIEVTAEAATYLRSHSEVSPLLNRTVKELAASVPTVPMLLDVFEEPDLGCDRLLLFLLVSGEQPASFDESYRRFWSEWTRSHSRQDRLALGLALRYV